MSLRFVSRLFGDRRGATAIEFAFAFPVAVALFIGVMQLGSLLMVRASIANAAGQAARFATLYPTPTDAQIETFARDSQFGIDPEKLTAVNVTRGTSGGRRFIDIELEYHTETFFLFMEGPEVDLSHVRRAYTSA